MQTSGYIWYNGKLVDWDKASTHVLTHGLHYGSGVFEGIRFYSSENGPAIFKLKEHVDRLFYSAGVLAMEITYSKQEISDAIVATVKACKLKEGYIRPLVYYGCEVMGVNPTGSPVDVMVSCWAWGAYLASDMVDIKTSKYIRIHPDSTVCDAKICGHYINGILASIELRNTHYHEALFLDMNGNIAEGTSANFFIIKDRIMYTPELGTILAGITRATVIDFAKRQGIKVVEKNIKLEDAYAADEAFFTGTAVEVTPIKSIDDKVIGNGDLGPISKLCKESYYKMVRGEIAEYDSAITYA
ncbi:MAG: branched-chain amino acid aminotransferase [Francisellaceae bacterium]|jgi:branched-chain amino acid aminotransferase